MTEALSQETLVRWRGKEFWAEDELLALLFGENPEISPREVEQDPPDMRAARICIWADPPIGIKAKKVHEKVHGQYKQMRYYAPEDVFQWVANKHYPDFPKFPDPIDWSFWLAMPEVELWEACALSLYISPDSLKPHPQGWMASSVLGPFFESKSFQSKGIEDQFAKRMRLVKTSIRQISGRVDATTVQLVDLVKWWPLSMGLLPAELRSLQDSLCSEIPTVVPLFDKNQPSVEQAAIPVGSIKQPCHQVARFAAHDAEAPLSEIYRPQSPKSPPPQVPKKKPLQRRQEEAIVVWLKANYDDIKRLPKPDSGKPGPHAAAREALQKTVELFRTRTTFEKAWARLLDFKEIQYGG